MTGIWFGKVLYLTLHALSSLAYFVITCLYSAKQGIKMDIVLELVLSHGWNIGTAIEDVQMIPIQASY